MQLNKNYSIKTELKNEDKFLLINQNKRKTKRRIKERTKEVEERLEESIDSFNKYLNRDSKIARSLRITLNTMSTDSSEVSKWLKKWFDALRSFKFCAVYTLEFTAMGYAHYHLLVRIWKENKREHTADYYRKRLLRLWERYNGGVPCSEWNLKPADNKEMAKNYLFKKGQFAEKAFQTIMRGKIDADGLGCKWWGKRHSHLFSEEVPHAEKSNCGIEKQVIEVAASPTEDLFGDETQDVRDSKERQIDGQPYDNYDLSLRHGDKNF